MKKIQERNYETFSVEGYSSQKISDTISNLEGMNYEVEYDPNTKEITVYYDDAREINKISDIVWEQSKTAKNIIKVEQEFRLPNTNIILEVGDRIEIIDEKDTTKTAKCPDCGNKYLVNTMYCTSCKKKVKE